MAGSVAFTESREKATDYAILHLFSGIYRVVFQVKPVNFADLAGRYANI